MEGCVTVTDALAEGQKPSGASSNVNCVKMNEQ